MPKSKSEKILLIGPPNVGKSVFFGQLTGLEVRVSNYAGTTVDYREGQLTLSGRDFTLIDVPGTYTLDASNEAEEIAVEMLNQEPGAVICVLDALNLESSLYLLLQILESGVPVIPVINRMDLLDQKNYQLDVKLLSRELKLPVLPAVAVEGQGLGELTQNLEKILLSENKSGSETYRPDDNLQIDNEEQRWRQAENLYHKVINKEGEQKVSTREKWGNLLIQPWPGFPLAAVIMSIFFGLVVGAGMGIRNFLLLPFFERLIFPPIIYIIEAAVSPGVIRNILIGEYGFLIKGLEWPLALVFPYIISFYSGLSLLEDSGYLPRLGVLLDSIFARIGLGGSGIIPLLLGYGCAIPGITATRALDSYRERLIVSTVICLSVPCIAQTGAFISLLAEQSILVVLALFIFSLLFLGLSAGLMSRFLEGSRPETVVEIPELLWPRIRVVGKKIWLRIKNFLVGGELHMIYAIALAAVLYETGVLLYLGRLIQPVVTGWLRLPAEAANPLILGIVRRELTVLPLLEMNLTSLQLFVAALVGLFYVPCIAVFAVLNSEFNLKVTGMVLFITVFTSFFLGGLVSRLGGLFL